MGYGESGVLYYVDDNGERVIVSAENPLPPNKVVYVTTIVSK